jgi:CheY-like chemotaxis protein
MPADTILVVDDEPVNLELARVLLQLDDYNVRLATNAQEALTVLRDCRPRLILVDLQMPGMDGLELTRRLKVDPIHRDAVVIALTASAMKGDEQKALAAGCDGYISKPIEPSEFSRIVADYLDASRLHSNRPESCPEPLAPDEKEVP